MKNHRTDIILIAAILLIGGIIALIVLCCFCNQNEGVGRSCR